MYGIRLISTHCRPERKHFYVHGLSPGRHTTITSSDSILFSGFCYFKSELPGIKALKALYDCIFQGNIIWKIEDMLNMKFIASY